MENNTSSYEQECLKEFERINKVSDNDLISAYNRYTSKSHDDFQLKLAYGHVLDEYERNDSDMLSSYLAILVSILKER